MFDIRFFTTQSGREPVQEFIRAEDQKARDKIYEVLTYLQTYGFHLPTPYLRRMSGTKHLWELRIKYQKQYRIFLARIDEQTIVLLHAIIKKTQKTPQRDLELARRRLREVRRDTP